MFLTRFSLVVFTVLLRLSLKTSSAVASSVFSWPQDCLESETSRTVATAAAASARGSNELKIPKRELDTSVVLGLTFFLLSTDTLVH